VTNDGVNRYLYDIEGRLCAVQNLTVGTITQYVYDAEGTRVAKGSLSAWPSACNAPTAANGFTLTGSYVLGLGGEQVTELAVSGATSTWVHTNIFAAGKLLATYHDSDTYFALTDWLGTKRAEITPDGKYSSFLSMPYGDGLSPSGAAADATEQHFTGKERDAESGNDYFGARYYASSMGRFMSPDPSGLLYADPANPQSLNLYSYGWNNPLHNIDPSGMECVWDDGSYDASDDPDTGNAQGCSSQGGTYIDPSMFESVEGNQAGSWSGQASSSVAFDWTTPSATVNGNTPWTFTDFQTMGQAWLSGILRQQLNYGPWTAETIDISHNFAVSRAVQAYIKAGCPASGTPANSFAGGHYEEYADSAGNIVLGQPDWLEAEVGGFSGTITGDGDTASITVNNPMSASSFWGQSTATGGHSLDNPNGPNGPQHTVMQTFKWSEQGLCQH
jgi:RHS repeat-associated protein